MYLPSESSCHNHICVLKPIKEHRNTTIGDTASLTVEGGVKNAPKWPPPAPTFWDFIGQRVEIFEIGLKQMKVD